MRSACNPRAKLVRPSRWKTRSVPLSRKLPIIPEIITRGVNNVKRDGSWRHPLFRPRALEEIRPLVADAGLGLLQDCARPASRRRSALASRRP